MNMLDDKQQSNQVTQEIDSIDILCDNENQRTLID